MKSLLFFLLFIILSCGTQKSSQENSLNAKCQASVEGLNTLIEKEDCDAEHKMGLYFFTGTCEPQNNNKALSYFYKAANKGQPKSQIILGNLFYQKTNDPMISRCPDCQLKKDLAEAIKWYTLASKNHPNAQDAAFLKKVLSDLQKEAPPSVQNEANKKLQNFKYTPFKCNPRANF